MVAGMWPVFIVFNILPFVPIDVWICHDLKLFQVYVAFKKFATSDSNSSVFCVLSWISAINKLIHLSAISAFPFVPFFHPSR